jgi:hypothetical protein
MRGLSSANEMAHLAQIHRGRSELEQKYLVTVEA